MKWVTRERPKIDRIACPWLIARFIDREPEFLFVPPGDVLATARDRSAIPYDVPDVELTHVGEQCSFDAFLRRYGSTTPHSPNLRSLCAAQTPRARSSPHRRRDCSRFPSAFLQLSRRPRNARTRSGGLRRPVRLVSAHAG